jgi:palmitoyltransferase ZDHHC9/14/18
MATDSSLPNSPTTPSPGLDVPRPPSLGGISSRMSDIASESGDLSVPVSPTGWSHSQAPASRRGPPPARNSIATTSGRPGSSSSRMSRMSKSHVPSLTSQAFLRPMSSQKLQAHRGGRPLTQGAAASEDVEDETNQNRRSLISNSTIRQVVGAHPEGDVPPSRGTEFTDPIIPDRNTSNASPTGNTTIRSLGESVRLLHEREKKPAPSHLNISKTYKPGSMHDPPQKSPMSFRSGFLSLQNKNEEQGRPDSGGHERLSSAASSSRRSIKEQVTAPPKRLGKNYEYFTGNTVFWGSGRFQNARDKPVNIATGILVVLPAGLFFGYSYVCCPCSCCFFSLT